MTGKRLLVLLAAAGALSIAAVACGGDDNKDVVRAPTATPTSASAVATPSLPPPAPSTAPTAAAPAPTTAAPLPPAPTPPPPAPPAAPAPVSLNVTISNFSYAPNPITVRAGQQLTLNVANQDSFPHTLSFTGGGGTGQISGGGRGTATFTRPAAGQVQFFCEIHGAARMSGTITILP